MYAVIETGGKQYRVEVGTEIEVEYLDVEPGRTFDIDRVLLVADGDATAVGRPLVDGARVSASVVRQDRGDKIVVFKYRPKARRRVKHGHRQELTVLRVSDIVHGDRSAARLAEADRSERALAAAAEAEEAAKRAAADQALAERLAAGRLKTESGTADSEPKATTKRGAPTKAADAAPKVRTPRARTQAPEPDQTTQARPRSRGTSKDQ